MKRAKNSHKGENGTVAVIGGSHEFHGAPIFSALAAQASGVDLVYPVVHECNELPTKMASPGFIVETFENNSLDEQDVRDLFPLLLDVHSVVMGPGMAETKENDAALKMLISNCPCAMVLDARALKPTIVKMIKKKSPVVLTPHLGELETLTGQKLTDAPRKEITELVLALAKVLGCTVLLKGAEDFVAGPTGKHAVVKGGDPGLTKGGTGDALAGLVAGLMAQGLSPFDAAVLGTRVIKQAGATLHKQFGYGYTTLQVIDQIAPALHRLSK